MLNIKIITVGKLKEPEFLRLCSEYLKRLGSYCSAELTELNEERLPQSPSPKQIEKALETEAAAILKEIPKGAHIIALCVEGKQMESTDFARYIREVCQTSSHICLIIGGSNGLADTVKSRAHYKLSFSKMTFPHHLFRVMLLEQVYRAFTINAGTPYHK